jgi:hypothetical protein
MPKTRNEEDILFTNFWVTTTFLSFCGYSHVSAFSDCWQASQGLSPEHLIFWEWHRKHLGRHQLQIPCSTFVGSIVYSIVITYAANSLLGRFWVRISYTIYGVVSISMAGTELRRRPRGGWGVGYANLAGTYSESEVAELT